MKAKIIYFFFCYLSYLEVKISRIGRLLLKFIPSSAAQSNPIFIKLLRGQSITSKDVKEFTENIKTTPDDLTFFCVLYYDYTGKITSSIGVPANSSTLVNPSVTNK